MIRGFSFQRGLSLLATMAFATSMMLFAAVIIALPVTFGQMERLRSNSQEAERMAWSITQLAQAELEANPEWGKDGTAELVLEGPGWPGKATLSFSTGDPNLRSVYNMSIDSNTIKGSLDNYVPSRSMAYHKGSCDVVKYALFFRKTGTFDWFSTGLRVFEQQFR